ncbi:MULTISPECIES: prolipoprotein diacylglyceryl transferase [Empedobacter]|uniref:Prolipoprotein diacylglyceryl transferase n=1 Tax=Empedobacter falsenii TaxID=343874 RepID=A0A7H9DU00_9FLAO|nr:MULTISPECIES: prolipoprotein diacylglyceryl transferase family protein [Empedobacter]MDH2206030.1 prolipoprotein diacylglyceryl transferase [Empedobacter sp. GD03644]QLL58682.1 prolipoprotein diacylglyceryl transferase [Empedobacter falsenii]
MTIDFPVSIEIFGHSVLIHPIFESVGIFIAMRYYAFLRKRNKSSLSTIQSFGIIIGALVGALLGSKIIGTLENPQAFLDAENQFLFFWTSNTIVGGLTLGLIGVELTKKIIGHKESTGDLIVFPLILAMIIGRIGCFLTGVYEQTYGIETTSIFGMNLGDGLMRHPVALYEIVYLLLLWIVLKIIQEKYIYPSGYLFQIFMLAYFLFRFCLDFIKPIHPLFLGLSSIQLTCVCVIIYYIFKLLQTKPKYIK